jgi:membrane protein involved in colicin uptake
LSEEHVDDGLNRLSTIKQLREQIAELEAELRVEKQKRSAEAEALKGKCKRSISIYKKLMQQKIDDLIEQLAASKRQVTEAKAADAKPAGSKAAQLIAVTDSDDDFFQDKARDTQAADTRPPAPQVLALSL